MTTQVSGIALREMVREILGEVIAEEIQARIDSGAGGRSPSAVTRERVVISSQADLDAAVRRIVDAAKDPAGLAALERGDISFVLEAASLAKGESSSQAAVVHRIEKGAVTERHVKAAAEAGAVIVTARRVVITPLARDRSRSLGVIIRKDS